MKNIAAAAIALAELTLSSQGTAGQASSTGPTNHPNDIRRAYPAVLQALQAIIPDRFHSNR